MAESSPAPAQGISPYSRPFLCGDGEMSLDEFVNQLPPEHRARRELHFLRAHIERLDGEILRQRNES